MFSSRNIHLAVLGLILGATSGYIVAFYRVQQTLPPQVISSIPGVAQDSGSDAGEDRLALFKEAVDKNPDDEKLRLQYANELFDREQFSEAVDQYRILVDKNPDNLAARTDMGTALWNLGRRDEARAAYAESLRRDPRHLMTLHNLLLVELDGNQDVQAAKDLLQKIESIDSKYHALSDLRQRIAAAQAKTGG